MVRKGWARDQLPDEVVSRLLWGPEMVAAIHSRAAGYQFIADGIGDTHVMEQAVARKEAKAAADALRSLAEELMVSLAEDGIGDEGDPWPLEEDTENVRTFTRGPGKWKPAGDRFGVLRR